MQSKKGFTLVELLAVVVILGILMMISIPAVSKWIGKSKEESEESNKSTLVMAAQSYAQGNNEVLPKSIGQATTVTAVELKSNNYLKENLLNADKKSCMDSYVKIYKQEKNQFQYTAYIRCEGDPALDEAAAAKPTIAVFFEGDGTSGAIQSVATSSFRAVITGGHSGNIPYKLNGYSYTISVKYTSDVNEKAIEIYNSGSIGAGGKESIVLEKSLSDYTDITKVNEFIVTVDAYNSEGGYLKRTVSSLYRDTTPPVCGTITGQATVGSWKNTKGSTRTISILCNDNEGGSGCVKDKYTKTFDTEMEYGTITISDNAGNTTNCTVRVNIDWTAPYFSAFAFAVHGALSNSSARASNVVSVSQSTVNSTISISSYSNSHNGWLNKANYPEGVGYQIEAGDNILLKNGTLYNNVGGIWSETSSYNDLQANGMQVLSASNNIYCFAFTSDGLRKAKYVVSDQAGNTVTMYFMARLDRDDPWSIARKSHTGFTDGVSVTVSCSDTGSQCSLSNPTGGTKIKKTVSYTVYDNAGNSSSCAAAVSSRDCHCSSCHHKEKKCSGGYKYSGTSCTYGCPSGGSLYAGSDAIPKCGATCCCKKYNSCASKKDTCVYGCDTCYY